MGGAGFPPCWFFGLRRPSTGAYRFFGGANGGLWECSHQMSTSQNFCCQCPCPLGEPQPPPASAGDPPKLAGRSGSVSCEVTDPSPPGAWCAHYFVCALQERSLCFSPVLLKSCNQTLLAFKVWFSGDSSSCCQTPRLGILTWGSESSLQWVDSCGIIVLQFVSRPPSGYGIWFVIAPLLPSHCGFSFVFGCGVSFLVSSSVFLLMTVQQLAVVLVLSQEGVRACPSTPPSSVHNLPILFLSFLLSLSPFPSHFLFFSLSPISLPLPYHFSFPPLPPFYFFKYFVRKYMSSRGS